MKKDGKMLLKKIKNLRAGKTIIPFCTNEGSGLGGSERDLKNLCKGATVKAGLSVHGAEAAESESKVAAWAKKSI